MFCTNCGKQISDTSSFCGYCGSKVIKLEKNEITSTTEEITSSTEETVAGEKATGEKNTVENASEENITVGNASEGNITVENTIEENVAEENITEENVTEENITQDNTMEENTSEYNMTEKKTSCNEKLQTETESIANHEYIDTQKSTDMNSAEEQDSVINSVNQRNKVEKDMIYRDVSHGKQRKKVVVSLSAVILIVAIGIAGVYFGYQKYLKSQPLKVIELYQSGKYEEALKLYEEKCEDRDNLSEQVLDKLSDLIVDVRDAYLNEEISYADLEEQIEATYDFADRALRKELDLLSISAQNIKETREYYDQGMLYFEEGDYDSAIEMFEYVEKNIDIAYYLKAQKGIKDAQAAINAEEERLEAEKEEKKAEILEIAESYALNFEYEEAMNTIADALSEFDYDDTLYEMYEKYEALYYESQYVYNYTTKYYEKEYYQGEINTFNAYLEYPYLEGDSPAYEKINATLEQMVNDFAAAQEATAEAISDYEEEYFWTNYNEAFYYMSYNEHGILCILFEGYEFSGGAHGMPYKHVYYFDLVTGEQLLLEDIIVDEAEFKRIVVEKYTELIESDPSIYWEEALDTVKSYEGYDYNCYLDDGVLYVYFYPYDLASFADGFVTVSLSLMEYSHLFSFLN